jgi:hypothetical protein
MWSEMPWTSKAPSEIAMPGSISASKVLPVGVAPIHSIGATNGLAVLALFEQHPHALSRT